MNVEWRPVVGFEATHEVSSDGRVRSLARKDKLGRWWPGRELRASGRLGLQVSLCAWSHLVYRKVHHLVLEAFVGPRPAGMECCHNNGDWRDNRLENLRWDTHKANSEDRIKHGRSGKGERHPRAKLDADDVVLIRAMDKQGMTRAEISKYFDVTRHHIGHILRGQSWSHLT